MRKGIDKDSNIRAALFGLPGEPATKSLLREFIAASPADFR